MLNDAQKDVIRATVPVLTENGVALITHFYNRMLTHNPELQQVFNITHQKTGHQAKALASAVLAYAQHIDNPAVLMSAVKHIGHKHSSVNIRAEHYPIVGHHLIESIKEVLGDGATHEVIDAWTKAYEQLAQIMIGFENDLFQKAALQRGGWSGWRSFVISHKNFETPNVITFTLVPVDKGAVPYVAPGQYVSVKVNLPEQGLVQPRQYTVTSANEHELQITVKRIGMVSTALHEAAEGTVVEVTPPMGEFTLPSGNKPLFMISAGIGVTPIVAMLKTVEENRKVQIVHVCKSQEDFALRNCVEALVKTNVNRTLHVHMTQQNGKWSTDQLASQLIPDADYVICGPDSFMKAVVNTLKSHQVDESRIHYERFGVGSI